MSSACKTPEAPSQKNALIPDFPDDPRKWDGWRNYQSENPYKRLCLDVRANPTDEQIQQHCTALVLWWNKKLPLKNQPSNPIAQLLGRGLDEASRHLAHARMQLLDAEQRRQIDADLAAAAEAEAVAEFAKYVAFSIQGGVLTADAEANLVEFGQQNELGDEQIRSCIDQAVQENNVRRLAPGEIDPDESAQEMAIAEAEEEFLRILRLSEVNMGDATESVRNLLANVAQNVGLDPAAGEDLLDGYLEEEELHLCKRAASGKTKVSVASAPKPSPISLAAVRPPSVPIPDVFFHPLGVPMLLIPAGEFVMGSDAIDAAPNEQPLTPVRLSEFYMARHPVTNAEFEQFDPSHRGKRLKGAGEDHPVVYVTSLEAVKFCDWLGGKDGKRYRLPTEAEWEYAARGTDGRKYPWGSEDGRHDLANFADASTTFPWRDPQLNDGYAESSPVGAYPLGASPFGIEDMAGNVWEWCLDFLQRLSGTPRQNPRGAGSAGSKRVYRGGSWKSRFSNLRATARASNAPGYSCNDLGFRLVCECGRVDLR